MGEYNRQKELAITLSRNVEMAVRNRKGIGKKSLISDFLLRDDSLLKKQVGHFPAAALFYWKEDKFLKRMI